MKTMRDETVPNLRQHLLDYLIALMHDVNDFSWTLAKASHAVLLCRMQQGEVKDFSDTFAILILLQILKSMYQIHS